jgi:hypothetical protein
MSNNTQIRTNPVQDNGPDFYTYHGYILSIMWFVGATAAIYLRKRHIRLHTFGFAIVNIVSLVFIIIPIVKVFGPDAKPISKRNTLYQSHVIGGIVAMSLLVLQHLSRLIPGLY